MQVVLKSDVFSGISATAAEVETLTGLYHEASAMVGSFPANLRAKIKDCANLSDDAKTSAKKAIKQYLNEAYGRLAAADKKTITVEVHNDGEVLAIGNVLHNCRKQAAAGKVVTGTRTTKAGMANTTFGKRTDAVEDEMRRYEKVRANFYKELAEKGSVDLGNGVTLMPKKAE